MSSLSESCGTGGVATIVVTVVGAEVCGGVCVDAVAGFVSGVCVAVFVDGFETAGDVAGSAVVVVVFCGAWYCLFAVDSELLKSVLLDYLFEMKLKKYSMMQLLKKMQVEALFALWVLLPVPAS